MNRGSQRCRTTAATETKQAAVGNLARREHTSQGSNVWVEEAGSELVETQAIRGLTERVYRTVDDGSARPGGAEVYPYEAALRRHRPHRTSSRQARDGGAAAEQVDRALTRAPCRSDRHTLQGKGAHRLSSKSEVRRVMEECCVVCAEPLEWVAIGPCGHREVCALCVVRLRFVLKDDRCCFCKQARTPDAAPHKSLRRVSCD
jgi:hypothetical protein